MTMRQVEELASQAAASAIVEYQEKLDKEKNAQNISRMIHGWEDHKI